LEPRPEPHERRRRPLGLHPRDPRDRRSGCEPPPPPEQQLPLERRATQLAERQRAHRPYATRVPPVVRFAPSPTGFLHIGAVPPALFNGLLARHEGGEFRLRIENTDTSREVAEATEQIQGSLRWLGLDWDGDVTFQLDRIERCQQEARQLVEEGKAYEDEGAI